MVTGEDIKSFKDAAVTYFNVLFWEVTRETE